MEIKQTNLLTMGGKSTILQIFFIQLVIMTIKSSVSLKLSNDVDVQELSSAVSLFSQDMYWNLANKSDNVLFSPLGIHAALSMAYLGARNETCDVMEKALEIIDIPDPHSAYNDLLQDLKDVIDVKILLSNGLWVNPASSLLQQYKTNVLTLYEATLEDIDFSFPEGPEASINKWIWYKTGINTSSMFTNGYIHRNTSLILINTFIFNANWQYPFPKEMTKKRMFTKLNGIPVATEFMSHSSIYALKLNAVKNVDVIRVPFEYEGFALYIALPRSSKGLHELESIITNENFDVHDLFANLTMTSVHLSMPKFNLTATLNFNLALSSLGMSEAFTNTSNFSGMSNTRLRLSDVVQKTTVQFSESYMTTPSFFNTNISIPVNNSSAPGDVNFIANHSFLYFLRDDINDLILLQGKYSDPEIQEIIVK